MENSIMMRKDELINQNGTRYDQYYYGHGKVLLSGEYLILDGAKGLALPTFSGQSLGVRYEQSYNPILDWKSFDVAGATWLEAQFEFWHFNILSENPSPEVFQLQKILRQARKQNKHFLRDSQNVYVETRLGFPRDWGLGSSSTLLYNTAQWAYTSPFELASQTFGGSGFDIACASSEGPIIYHLEDKSPHWSTVHFNPSFHENLFFVYQGNKQNTRSSIASYRKNNSCKKAAVERVNEITAEMVNVQDILLFNELIHEHEKLISKFIDISPVHTQYTDFPGAMKSLGAWGGDFILASCNEMTKSEVINYFTSKGHDTVIPFSQFALTAVESHCGLGGSLIQPPLELLQ